MVQCNRVIDTGAPCGGLEREACRTATLRYRWQLEEVASDDELDTAEGTSVVPQSTCNLFELVEQLAVDHGYLVDNEHARTHPPLLGLLVALDFLTQRLRVLLA